MTRTKKTVAAVTALAATAPGVAWAVTATTNPATELGATTEGAVPACPSPPCKALSRTTAYQVKVGDERDIDLVKANGRIVAWTVTMSKPGPSQIAYFDKQLGGEAQAQLTVLRPGNKQYARVIAQGEPVKLKPYFGQKVTFALKESIPVAKGNIVGITTTTWAPVLAVNQPGTTSWRATRARGGCSDFVSPTQQTKTDNITRFYCLYRTARLIYSVTIVPNPRPNS